VKFEQSFDVQAHIEEVWAALIDVQRVAPCLPGAEVTEGGEDGVFHGTFQVKLGPTTASYAGRLEMVSLEEASHTATMRADGRDKRGQGGAKATIVSRMTPAEGGGTRVEVETDFSITGRLASFGRGGMMQDISNRLLREFAACLQAELEGGSGGAPLEPEVEPAAPTAASGTGDPAPPPPPPPPRPTGPPRPAAQPLDAGSLAVSALRERLSVGPVAAAAGVLGALWLLRRRRR